MQFICSSFPLFSLSIRMESFQECGVQMLREFRTLLQQTPLPVNQTRLLQLLALNMFAVSNTQLKGKKKKTSIDPSLPAAIRGLDRLLYTELTVSDDYKLYVTARQTVGISVRI